MFDVNIEEKYIERVQKLFQDMPPKVRTSLLFNVYGALLNEHRKRIMSFWLDDDYSLSEIAEEMGITRQGVHDTIKKCETFLLDTEVKLGFVERMLLQKEFLRKYMSQNEVNEEAKILFDRLSLIWEESYGL